MNIASAAAVAALGVRFRPNGWMPIRAICHVPSRPNSKSMAFNDPAQPGYSLIVRYWAGCDKEIARHALQNAVFSQVSLGSVILQLLTQF